MSKSLILRVAALVVILAATFVLQSCASDSEYDPNHQYYNPEIYPGGLPYDPRWED